MRSVRRLLVLGLLVVIVVISLVTAGLSYREALTEAGELFDAKLAHSARVLRALSDDSLADEHIAALGEPLVIEVWQGEREGQGEDLVTEGGHAYETRLVFQVWRDPHHLLLRSQNAPTGPLAPLHPGFSHAHTGDQAWRVFTLQSPRGLWYQAAESDTIRSEIARDIAFGSLLPLLAGMPVLALLMWLIVSWGCRPLSCLATELGSRAPDRLDALATERMPLELQPLGNAVNGFMLRLGEAIERERRLTTDAAHELRTPIAAVRVHAANARSATNPDQRRRAIDAVEEGMVRLDRLVEQLLVLGRLEPGASLPRRERVDLGRCVASQVGALVEAGMGREVELELLGRDAGAHVCGDAIAIGTLVRNLADNALRYTPPQGTVRITVDLDAGAARLQVEDSGPGIDEAARARVFDRYHRELGTGTSGSGLGLSIVRRAAELHDAQVTLDMSAALGGLRVEVRFAAA